MHHDSIADGVDGRSVGVVEFDALMRLEVAAHRRAEAVCLIDVGLIGARNWAAKPNVLGPGDRGTARNASGVRSGPRLAYLPSGALFPCASTVVGVLGALNGANPDERPVFIINDANPQHVLIL